MDLRKYIRDNFTGRSVVLVGNAAVEKDWSERVDQMDVVVRFNYLDHFEDGLTGEKFTHWVVNHHTSEKGRRGGMKRSRICHIAVEQRIPVITPAPPGGEFKRCREYYQGAGLALVYPDREPFEFGKKAPRIGFRFLRYLLDWGQPFSVIGYSSGGSSPFHDPEIEYKFILAHQDLITIIDKET